jgi:hypothetical protein
MNLVGMDDEDDDLPLPSFANIFSDHLTTGASGKKRKKSTVSRSSDAAAQDETTG